MQITLFPTLAAIYSVWFLVEAACAFLRRPFTRKWRAIALAVLLVLLTSWVPLTESEEGFGFFPPLMVPKCDSLLLAGGASCREPANIGASSLGARSISAARHCVLSGIQHFSDDPAVAELP